MEGLLCEWRDYRVAGYVKESAVENVSGCMCVCVCVCVCVCMCVYVCEGCLSESM